ncbi:MAG: hypothetical protein LBL17_00005 [Coxiellaceae bacterium]|nr:hypothetical protein [Coxiellaceae bacterium]
MDLSSALLKQFGGMRNLFDASKKQVCNFQGMGKTKYTKLQAALEISRRYLEEQIANTNYL